MTRQAHGRGKWMIIIFPRIVTSRREVVTFAGWFPTTRGDAQQFILVQNVERVFMSIVSRFIISAVPSEKKDQTPSNSFKLRNAFKPCHLTGPWAAQTFQVHPNSHGNSCSPTPTLHASPLHNM